MLRKVLMMPIAVSVALFSISAEAQLMEILNTVKAATDTYNAVSGVVGKVAPPATSQNPPQSGVATSTSTIPVGATGDTAEEPKLGPLTGAQKTSIEQKQSFCINGNKVAAFPYEGDYQGVALILNVNGSERIIPLQSTDKNLEGHHSLWGGTVHLAQINGYQLKVSRLDPSLYSFEVTKADGYKKNYMTKVC